MGILCPILHWMLSSVLIVVASRSQVSQPYRRMGIMHVSKMLWPERGLRLPRKALKTKKSFPGLADVLMDSTSGWQVVLPPNSQTFNCRGSWDLNMIIHATNDSNLLSRGWRSEMLSDSFWKCFVAKLERFLLVWLHDKSAIFTPQKMHMRMNRGAKRN